MLARPLLSQQACSDRPAVLLHVKVDDDNDPTTAALTILHCNIFKTSYHSIPSLGTSRSKHLNWAYQQGTREASASVSHFLVVEPVAGVKLEPAQLLFLERKQNFDVNTSTLFRPLREVFRKNWVSLSASKRHMIAPYSPLELEQSTLGPAYP